MELMLNVMLNVTDEDVDDIMYTALESGIGYWCGRVEAKDEYLGDYASEQISRGGTLIFYDLESPDRWEMDKEKFLLGLIAWLERNPGVIDKKKIDLTLIDEVAADVIIQMALFDEIQFG